MLSSCSWASLSSADSEASLSCRSVLTCCSLASLCLVDSAASLSCLHCRHACLCSTIWAACLTLSLTLHLANRSSRSAVSEARRTLPLSRLLWSLLSFCSWSDSAKESHLSFDIAMILVENKQIQRSLKPDWTPKCIRDFLGRTQTLLHIPCSAGVVALRGVPVFRSRMSESAPRGWET